MLRVYLHEIFPLCQAPLGNELSKIKYNAWVQYGRGTARRVTGVLEDRILQSISFSSASMRLVAFMLARSDGAGPAPSLQTARALKVVCTEEEEDEQEADSGLTGCARSKHQ